MNDNSNYRNWAYKECGDYHKNLDLNWSYAPTYLQKEKFVNTYIQLLPKDRVILDVGCGEGVFVEKYYNEGYQISGIDLNYSSNHVTQGSVLDLPYDDNTFGTIIFLDVFEHLAFDNQYAALKEIYRVLKPEGELCISVPNLAHLNSRFRFFFKGGLDRTDVDINHLGERPLREYIELIQNNGFEIVRQQGITLTLPIVYRRLICKHAKKLRWLHDMFEPIARLFPSLAMLTIFVCRKK